MSAERVCDKISYTQGGEFINSLVRAGLSPALCQCIIDSKRNLLAQSIIRMLKERVSRDGVFELRYSFELTVPAGFNSSTCIDTLQQDQDGDSLHFYGKINSARFSLPYTLKPGERFEAMVYGTNKCFEPKNIKNLIEEIGAIPLGPVGLVLAYMLERGRFPIEWLVSPVEKEVDNKPSDLPGIFLDSQGKYHWGCPNEDYNELHFILFRRASPRI